MRRTSAAGVRFHALEVVTRDVSKGSLPNTVEVGKWLVAPVQLALAQSLTGLNRNDAVAVLDNAIHRGAIRVSDIPWLQRAMSGRPGATKALPWLALADGRSESPLETSARLDCIDGGVAPDYLQLEFKNSNGRVVARVDLAWDLPGGKYLVLEVDGASIHSEPDALFRDRERSNVLQSAGVVILRVTARDLYSQGRVAGLVKQALARHGRQLPVHQAQVIRKAA